MMTKFNEEWSSMKFNGKTICYKLGFQIPPLTIKDVKESKGVSFWFDKLKENKK